MTQPISYLRDDFADNTTASAWSAAAVGSATVAEASGQARLTLPSNTAGSHVAYYLAGGTYDLTSDGCYLNIAQMVSTSVAATARFELYIDSSNMLRWTQTSGTLKAQTTIASVTVDRYSATWSGTTYKYLRIRESAGTVYWDSSTNGFTWTNRFSMANPFAVTALAVTFSASCGNVASPGAFYVEDFNLILPALTTNWRWVEGAWSLTHRFRNVTLAIDTVATVQGYLAVYSSIDTAGAPVSPVYYSGPIDSQGNLTLQPTQAAAQAMAVNLPLDGRWSLPAMVEARFIRLYARSIDGSSFILREQLGRRLIQADDIEAEAIRAHHIAAAQILADHIAAGAITAGKIDVDQLSAIAADMGTITAGTITGALIRTSASNPRVEMSSSAFKTYDGSAVNLVEMSTSTSGALNIYGLNSLIFKANAADSTRGRVGFNGTQMEVGSPSGDDIYIHAGNIVTLRGDGGIVRVANTNSFEATGGVNVGTATGAGTGEIKTSAAISSATTITAGSTTANDGTLNSRSSADTKLVLTDTRSYSNGTTRIVDLHFKAANPASDFTTNSATIRADITPATGITIPASEFSFWTANNTVGVGKRLSITGVGDVLPGAAGTQNLGNASLYWNDVSYKTLTDRGCLALIDEWELPDGRRVPATQVFQEMKVDPSKRTVYGEPMLDYMTVPKHSRKAAPVAAEDIYEDDPNERGPDGKPKRKIKHRQGERMGDDGVEMTSLFSQMIGAIRELTSRVAVLEGGSNGRANRA